jgi:hypothetical protein
MPKTLASRFQAFPPLLGTDEINADAREGYQLKVTVSAATISDTFQADGHTGANQYFPGKAGHTYSIRRLYSDVWKTSYKVIAT